MARIWENQFVSTLDLTYFEGSTKKEDCWYNIPGQEFGTASGCDFDTTGFGVSLGVTRPVWSNFHLQAGLSVGQRELRDPDRHFIAVVNKLSSRYFGAFLGFTLLELF